ncbi:hypothetical protein COOONC_08207 [Cooperia oncophora]
MVDPAVHKASTPTAPSLEQSERQTMSNENTNGAGYPDLNHDATAEQRRAGEPSPYNEPPPAYNAAMGYPTTPYPSGGLQNAQHPSQMPKPYPQQYPVHNQPPIYHAIHTVGGAQPQQVPVPTHVVVAVGNGSICPFWCKFRSFKKVTLIHTYNL